MEIKDWSHFGICCMCNFYISWASLIAQLVNNLPAMQETPVPLLGWKDLLEKE